MTNRYPERGLDTLPRALRADKASCVGFMVEAASSRPRRGVQPPQQVT